MENKISDVLIIGGGMAGLTAALYSVRYNLKTTIVAKTFGGTGNIAGHVENWPGFTGSGLDLMNKIVEQVRKTEVIFVEGEATKVGQDELGFFVEVNLEKIYGKTLIISLGMEHRKLGVPGEHEFSAKGVSYCSTCDGMLFKNKTVAVVGGGDSAVKSVIYLSDICKKVYWVHRRNESTGEPIGISQIDKKQNVEKYFNSVTKEIIGDRKVRSLKVIQDGKEISIDLDGIFVEIGAAPTLKIIENLGLKRDTKGFIEIDRDCKTNIAGIFAAGDNTVTSFKQFVVSAGEGAIAAKTAYDFLKYKN